MADKSFGVKELNLLNASGTPTVTSPNNLNLNANTVAISTSCTIGNNLTVTSTTNSANLNVTGIGTLTRGFATDLSVSGISTISQPSNANPHSLWDVVNNGSSAYRFTGPGQSGDENNPNIYLVRGQRYIFKVNASGHPFQLRVANGGAAYSDGVTNNGAQSGNVVINVQHDAPAQLYYQCTSHGGMVGNIYIVGGPQVISGVTTFTGLNVTTISGITSITDTVHFTYQSNADINKKFWFWGNGSDTYAVFRRENISSPAFHLSNNTRLTLGTSQESEIVSENSQATFIKQYTSSSNNPLKILSDYSNFVGSPTSGHSSRKIADFEYAEGASLYYTGTKRLQTSGVGVTITSQLDTTNIVASGVVTATSFVGSGANLTSLPAQATIANNADNRVITGGSGVNLNGESSLTFDGSKLSINATSSAAGNLVVKSADGSSNQVWIVGRSSDNTGSVSFRNNADNAYTGRIEVEDTNGMQFQVGGSERLRIASNGLVSVKTNGLNLENATATSSRAYSITNAAGTTGWTFGNGVTASSHQFVIYDNTAGAARITIDSDGKIGHNKTASGCTFDVEPVNNTHAIRANGQQAGYATIICDNRASSGTRHYISFRISNGVTGKITSTGSSTVYATSSDYRLKENVTAISDGITRLKTLKPSRFNWKADSSTTVDGFLAHEVTAVPEAVVGTKDEVDSDNNPVYQAIDEGKLVPLLTAALQEAITKIETLEAKVSALEGS